MPKPYQLSTPDDKSAEIAATKGGRGSFPAMEFGSGPSRSAEGSGFLMVRGAVSTDARDVLALVNPADPDSWMETWPFLMRAGKVLVSCRDADSPPAAVAFVTMWQGLDGPDGMVSIYPRGKRAGPDTHRGELLKKAQSILRKGGVHSFTFEDRRLSLYSAHSQPHGPRMTP